MTGSSSADELSDHVETIPGQTTKATAIINHPEETGNSGIQINECPTHYKVQGQKRKKKKSR